MIVRRYVCFAVAVIFSVILSLKAVAQQPLPAEGDESQLLKVLNSDAEVFDKAKACQRLAIIGTAKSVPVLTKLLADPELSHYSRFALESNPSSAVDRALREALDGLSGRQLVGVINSIASRKDAQAANALIAFVSNEDAEVAVAAISALGAIGTPESIVAIEQVLSTESPLRSAAADASLTAADRLLVEGKNADALKILKLLRSVELPKHINVAARFGEIRSGSIDTNELMDSFLQDSDLDLFRIGLELAHNLTDADTTKQLVKHLGSLPKRRRILLMHVLGDRGDSSAIEAVIEAAESEDADMKIAAVRVLGALGDVRVVPLLLKAADSEDETLAATARDSLVVLAGDDVDAQLARRLRESDERQRLVLVEVAGRRGISDVIPLLLQYASSENSQLRSSAIDGLGMTIGLKDFPELVDEMLMSRASDSAKPIKEALRKACQRMGDRDAAADVLLDRMDGASADAQIELMDLLIYVGGNQALAGVKTRAEGSKDSAADAATQALGRWLTPDAAPVLLDLAQSGNEKYRVRCLRGYIRIIRQFGLRSGQRLQMSKKAMAAATRDQERKLVLDTLTRFPSVQGLKMITPHLSAPSLSEDACKSAVVIGEQIIDKDPKPVAEAMEKVVIVSRDIEVTNRAKVLLARSQ